MGSTGAVQRFQVACQNEKCQVQRPSPLTDKLDLSHSTAQHCRATNLISGKWPLHLALFTWSTHNFDLHSHMRPLASSE